MTLNLQQLSREYASQHVGRFKDPEDMRRGFLQWIGNKSQYASSMQEAKSASASDFQHWFPEAFNKQEPKPKQNPNTNPGPEGPDVEVSWEKNEIIVHKAIEKFFSVTKDVPKDGAAIWQAFMDFLGSNPKRARHIDALSKLRSNIQPLLQKAATEHAKNAAPEGPTEKDIQQVCDAVQSADLQNQPYTADPKHFLEMLATGQKELREAVGQHADILNNAEVAAAVAERHQSAIRQWNERDLGAAQREVAAALQNTGSDVLNFDDFVDRHVRQQPSVQLLQQSRDDATLKTMWKGSLRQTVRAAYQEHMERALQSAARAAAASARPNLAVMNATNYRAAIMKTPQMQTVFAAAPKLRLRSSAAADAEIAAGFEAFKQAELQRDYQSLRGVVAAGLGRAATSSPKSYEDFLQTALAGTQSLAKKWPTEELWSANGDALSKQCKQAYAAACTAAATNLAGTLPVPTGALASQNAFIGQMLGQPQLARFTKDPRLAGGILQSLQNPLANRYQTECQQMRNLGQQALMKMQKDAKPKDKETHSQLASRLLQEASSKGVLAAQANFLQTDGQMKQAASTVATALIEHRKQQQKEETQRQESQEQSSPLTPKVRDSAAKQVQAMLSKSPALTKAQALQQLFDQKEWQPFAKAMAADREFLASVDKVFASRPPAQTGKEYAADLVEAGAQDFWDARGKALEQHLLQLPPDQRQQAGAAFVRQSAPAAIAKAVMADKRFTQLLKAPMEAEAAPQAQSVAALRAQLLSADSVQAVAGASRAECAAVVSAALGEGAKTMQPSQVRQLSQELFRAATAAQKKAKESEKADPPTPNAAEKIPKLQQLQARLGKAIGAASAQKITSFLQDVQEKNGQLPPESQLLQALENAPKNARTPEELLAQLGLQNLKQSTAGSRAAMLGALQQLIDVQVDQADQLSAAEAEQADAKTEEEADDEKDKDADDEKGGVFNAPEMEKKKKGGGIGKFREGKGLGEAQNEDENESEQANALPEEGDDKQAAAGEAEKQQVVANQIDDGQAGQKLAQLVEQAAAEHQPKISQEQDQNQPNALPQAAPADSEEAPLHLLAQQDSATESAPQPEQANAERALADEATPDTERDPALQQKAESDAEQQQNQPDSQAESMAEGQQAEELQQPAENTEDQVQSQADQLPPEQAEADAPLPRQQAEQMTEQNQEQKDQQEQQEAKALEEQEQAENEQLLATAQAAAEAMEQEMQKTQLSKEAMERVQALTMLVQTAEQEEDEERLLHLLAKQTPEDDALKKVLEKVAPKLTPAGFGMAALPFLLVYAGAHLRQGMPLWQLAEKVLDCLCILRGERNTTTTQALPAAITHRPVRRPREVFFTLLGSASRAKWIDANKAHAKLALSSKRSGGITLSISAPKHKPWKQTAPLALAGGGS